MGEKVKEEEKKKKSSVKSNLLKWGLILALIIFAGIKNKEFVDSAIKEIKATSKEALLFCVILANMYYIIEGCIISLVTKTGPVRLSVVKGIICAYMCAFYKLATLGSGNGIAQLYYYNINGINVSSATGMAISQYTFQKITIGVMGVLCFIGLVSVGDERIQKYTGYMLAGTVVISLICLFLFIITVSKKISDFLVGLGRKLVKKESKLYAQLDRAEEAIECLQTQGRAIWRNKLLFVQVVILDVLKFTCWYLIPGIVFAEEFDVSILLCAVLMSICNMIGCVMIAPSGVGTLEFVFAVFFSAIIKDAGAIAATIVIYRFFTWIMPFLIGIIPAVLVKKKDD